MGLTEPLPPLAMADRTCAHTVDGTTFCGAPGTRHIRWDAVRCSFSCDEHDMAAASETISDRHRDSHPVGADCGLPGTLWVYSETRPPGLCAWDDELGTELRASASEPIPVGAA